MLDPIAAATEIKRAADADPHDLTDTELEKLEERIRFLHHQMMSAGPEAVATALRQTWNGGTSGIPATTVGQLRQMLAEAPDDAVVLVPLRGSREHSAAVVGMIPVWWGGGDTFVQENATGDPGDPAVDLMPIPGRVLYGVLLDPGHPCP